MKYVDEYRDGALARDIAAAIAAEAQPDRHYALMEFCGGHTHAISRYGLEDLLPPNLRLIHGPGCPVCVLPIGRIDDAIRLARDPAVTLCTYADMMRVPGSNGASLLKARAAGADIRMIYSSLDAVRIAEAEPARQVVFFAIGFETTTPPTAIALRQAMQKGLTNFSIFCNHVLTPDCHRRVRRPGACLHHHRHSAIPRIFRRLPQAGSDRRVRAAGRDAGDPDAGAPGQPAARRGGERVHPRGET
jgi:hydrogenase expression/formation protein HypD